jgi:hypothetical protein
MSQEPQERVSLGEIAKQMRQQRLEQDATRPLTRVAQPVQENQPAPSASTVPTAPQKTGLRALAHALRFQNVIVGVVLALIITDHAIKTPMQIANHKMTALQTTAGFLIFIWALSIWRLLYLLYGWIMVAIALVVSVVTIFSPGRPIIALVVWIGLNMEAAKRLRKAGGKVGLFGASPASVPE